jgi:taurine dioxygenase
MATISPPRLFDVAPMRGGFGAMIDGLDLAQIDDGLGDALRLALNRHGVLFYRPGPEARVSDEQFIALAEAMGEILVYPYRVTDQDYADKRLSRIDTDSASTNRLGTALWHTDGTPEECPPSAAMIGPVDLPGHGGDTMFADMVAAWEALSPRFQRMLDGLEALHSTDKPARRSGEPAIYGKGSHFVHPAVLTDPATGRRMLYVNAHYTERLIGLSERESAMVLQMLYEHINTPEFHIRWEWQPHDIAIWEERLTQHRACTDFAGRRVMRRTAIKGDRPR